MEFQNSIQTHRTADQVSVGYYCGQHFITVYLITKLFKSWVKTNLKRQNVEQKKDAICSTKA